MSLSASFEVRLPALRVAVDLQAAPGEVVAIIGPNGAGKTTVLKALAGLLRISSGRIAVNDQLLADSTCHLPPQQRRVGLLFQDHLLFPHLSALDNVAFGLRANGLSRTSAYDQALRWLAEVGADDLVRARPSQLSGGQAQRVALARALAVDPHLVLLDEPTASLDPGSAMALRTLLRDHLTRTRAASILVTHTALDALVVADRLLVLEAGRVVQTGAPAAVAAQPRTDHVAALVGMNLLRGSATRGVVQLRDGTAVVSTSSLDGPAFAAFSPAAVSLYAQRPHGSPRNVWPGVVEAVTPHGDAVRVQVGGPTTLLADVTPAALTGLDLQRGRRVWTSVKATEVTVYAA